MATPMRRHAKMKGKVYSALKEANCKMATSVGRGANVKGKVYSALIRSNGDCVENGSKRAKKINLELGNAETRQQGLKNLGKLLESHDEMCLAENISVWLKILPQMILQENDELAAKNLKVILSQACQVPSISREIATNLIPTILTNLLQRKEQNAASITGIESILSSYPASCGNLRSQIVKVMLPLMMSSIDEPQNATFRCWALVPFLGGGGGQKSTHSQQWQEQLNQTIKALKFAFQNYKGDESEETLDPSVGSLSLPFSHLPSTEPELSHTLVKRICVACRCLCSLLDVEFSHSVQIPIDTIMETILDILDATPNHMGNTTEMLLRASFLHKIHRQTLDFFGKLCKICGRNLCRYSSKINRCFSALLDMWKDKAPFPGKDKKQNSVRSQIYTAILDWLENCGATTRFLCGPIHLNQSLVKHLVDDITPVKNVLQVSNTKLQSGGGSKKAKKRRYAEATQEMLNGSTTDRIQNPKANSGLTIAALKVMLESIITMQHRLSPNIHKIFQESVIMLLLQIQQGLPIIPYTSCSGSRLFLYKVLLSLTLSPVPSLAPPTALCTKIFVFAVSRERNSGIQSYCRDGITALNNVIHPWSSAWHTCTVDTRPTSDKPQVTIPVIEPMNLDEESEVDDEQMEDSDEDNSSHEDTSEEPQETTESLRSSQPALEDEHDQRTSKIATADVESINGLVEETAADEIINIPPEEVNQASEAEIEVAPTGDVVPASTDYGDPEVDGSLEEVNKMILDFVDVSPDGEME